MELKTESDTKKQTQTQIQTQVQVKAEDKKQTKSEPKSKSGKDRAAGNWLESYLKYARGQESPDLFHLWVSVSTIASVLRRNVFVSMGYFKIFPNFYVVLVSPSGTCRKGIAIDLGGDFVKKVDGINICRSKLTPEFLLTFLQEKSRMVSVSVTDTNDKSEVEAENEDELGDEKKKNNPAYEERTEAFIVAPELSTMLGAAAYAGDLKAVLTDLFDNKKDDEYGTKTSGQLILHNVNINFIGGSNPTWLARSFSEDSFGGGFMGRIIFVYQEHGKKIPWPEKSEEAQILEKLLILDLQHISRLKGCFRITQGARDFVSKWYMEFDPEVGTRMSGYYERKQIHLIKLAMILSVAENDNLVISDVHCKAALFLLDQVEAWMPDAFAFIGATLEAHIEQRIIDFLRGCNGAAKEKDVLKYIRKDVKGKREFNALIETMRASGTITAGTSKDGTIWFVLTEEYNSKLKEFEKRKKDRRERLMNRKKNSSTEEKKRNEKY